MRPRASRFFTNALASLSLCFVAATTSRAQQPAPDWVTFAPADEQFGVLAPVELKVRAQPALASVGSPAGQLYAAKRDTVEYRVWSFQNPQPAATPDPLAASDFLDSCAELTWTVVVEPELNPAMRAGSRDAFARYSMTFVRETKLAGGKPGYLAREYNVSLSERRGRAYLFTDGARAYVALAYGQGVSTDANVRAFLDSFTFRATGGESLRLSSDDAASPAALPPLGVGPGRGGNIGGGGQPSSVPAASCDELSKRVFAARDATTRARIFSKPEPSFTEWARKFTVTGTVRLRAVLRADGTLTDIEIIKGLPHGLTHSSIDAMRRIQFEPAMKDGCKVSQSVMVEYNYNIY